jgi:hypothetical protein
VINLPEAVFDAGAGAPNNLGVANSTKIVPSRQDFAALLSERNSYRSIVETVPFSLLRTTRPWIISSAGEDSSSKPAQFITTVRGAPAKMVRSDLNKIPERLMLISRPTPV